MLYVTTRGTKDAFTAHRTLCSDTAPDGGCFVPMSMPRFQPEDIKALSSKSFGQIVAEIINLLFSTQLSGWDIDLMTGRNTVKVFSLTQKLKIAELWHNSGSCFSHMVQNLYRGLCKNADAMDVPSDWSKIAIRISVYFALYAQLLSGDHITVEQPFDLALSAGDFTPVIAALYAREMGLPIRKVICTVGDSSGVWDLIQRGCFTAANVDMHLLQGLERLVQLTMGTNEVARFNEKCQNRRPYYVDDEMLPALNADLFCAVAGQSRTESTINSVFRSNDYILDPDTAHCYGGLQDYRSKSGENKFTLLLSEASPLQYAREITSATGLAMSDLAARVNRTA